MKNTHADIIIAGAGIAGVSAALAAARHGHKVILIEKYVVCGGLATAGNVLWYPPLCDGYGKQVIHGIADELLNMSLAYGPGNIDPDWKLNDSKARLMAHFTPAAFMLALFELLKGAKIDVWFDTIVTNTHLENNQLNSISVYNKSGTTHLSAHCFVDATGDADLAVASGAKIHVGQNRMNFWYLYTSLNAAKKAVSEDDASSLLRVKVVADPDPANHISMMSGVDGATTSQLVSRTHELALMHTKEKQAEHGRHNHFPAILPTMASTRMTRGIIGRSTIDGDDIWRERDDSVAIYPSTTNPAVRNQMWELPYGSLLPEKIDGLLMAGRCIDSRNWAWNDSRLINVVALTGEIAGTAAAMSVTKKCTPHTLTTEELRKTLRSKKHYCTFSDCYGTNWKDLAARFQPEQVDKTANGH